MIRGAVAEELPPFREEGGSKAAPECLDADGWETLSVTGWGDFPADGSIWSGVRVLVCSLARPSLLA